jgi:uncharacterized phiE125 gp8 family phage protein
MNYPIRQTDNTPPTEPLTRERITEYLRIDGEEATDEYLDMLIVAARMSVEKQTNLNLVAGTFKWKLPSFPSYETIPLFPVNAITSIKYYDVSGTQITIGTENYRLIQKSDYYSAIEFVSTYNLPALFNRSDAVEIVLTSGLAVIPDNLKIAMLLRIKSWYDADGDTKAQYPSVSDTLISTYAASFLF